jgi:hypothetical protein
METQALFSQYAPNPHWFPHWPQLFASFERVAHVPLQLVSPAEHPQEPFEQTVPPLHTVPQPPQLLLSLVMSRQLPEQRASPA